MRNNGEYNWEDANSWDYLWLMEEGRNEEILSLIRKIIFSFLVFSLTFLLIFKSEVDSYAVSASKIVKHALVLEK